jgi:hypothetical protein
MALNSVLSAEVRPECIPRYTAAIARLAEAARKKKEPFTWGAFQTLFGAEMRFYYASSADSFKALEARGTVPDLVTRVLGAADAPRFLEEVGGYLVGQELTLSIDRPDLSYLPRPLAPREIRAASVIRARVRPGARETFEELARKLAEAIPKADDPSQLIARQVIVGNPNEYQLIRPLRELAELDSQLPPDQLLTRAFGAGEGGLLFRNGGDALLSVERSIVGLVEPLSNPMA